MRNAIYNKVLFDEKGFVTRPVRRAFPAIPGAFL